MSFWAGVVRAIHLIVVLVIIISPFYAEQLSLTSYVILLPFIVIHWITSNNICILTLIEQKLRKRAGEPVCNDDDLFIGSIITPVYDVHNRLPSLSKLIYIGTGLLWLIALIRLQHLYSVKGIAPLFQPKMVIN
jgi:hypothetical protein